MAGGVPGEDDAGDPASAERMNERAIPAHGRRVRPVLLSGVLISLLVAGAIAARSWGRPSALGPALSIVGNSLIAKDSAGKTLWTHTFEAPATAADSRNWLFSGDVDADGQGDAVVAVEITRPEYAVPVVRLYRFDERGQVIWFDEPKDRLTFQDGEYGPPWASWDVGVYRAAGQPRIAWSVHHYTWWPSQLISYDANGQRVGTFVNSGWIARAIGTRDEKHLVFVGLSKLHDAYVLGVLDATQPSGTSPEPEGVKTECLSCPPQRPLHYFVFPRGDVAEQFLRSTEAPSLTVFEDGSLAAHMPETAGPNAGGTIYELGPDFRLRGMRVSDAYDQWHRRLEGVAHSVEECPHRRERAIRHWTNGAWKIVRIAER